jgi:hypothetical protein
LEKAEAIKKMMAFGKNREKAFKNYSYLQEERKRKIRHEKGH